MCASLPVPLLSGKLFQASNTTGSVTLFFCPFLPIPAGVEVSSWLCRGQSRKNSPRTATSAADAGWGLLCAGQGFHLKDTGPQRWAMGSDAAGVLEPWRQRR